MTCHRNGIGLHSCQLPQIYCSTQLNVEVLWKPIDLGRDLPLIGQRLELSQLAMSVGD